MVSKSSMPDVSQFLVMILFAAALFNSLHANAEDKKFEVNKTHTSARAICEKKEFNATIEFDPTEYSENEDSVFNLMVGGCNLTVEARKNKRGGVLFSFYKEGESNVLGRSDNPKSFLVQEQSLTFVSSIGGKSDLPKVCNDGFKFNPIEGQGNFTLEITLEGEGIPEKLVLKADNLIYEQSESEKGNSMLWVWISVGVGSFLFIAVIVAIVFVGICIYRKRKAAASKESNVQFKPEVNVENIAIAKEVSQKRRPSKEKPSADDSKPSKTLKTDQKPSSVRPSSQEAKPIETQVEKPAVAQSQEAMPAIETQNEKLGASAQKEKSAMDEKPDPRSVMEPVVKKPEKKWAFTFVYPKYAYVQFKLESGETKVLKVEVEPKRDRQLDWIEKDAIQAVKEILDPEHPLHHDIEEKLRRIKKRDQLLAIHDEMHENAEEAKRKRAAEEALENKEKKKQKE